MSRLDDEFETALALGGMMFKPYLSHGKICIDLIRADCFLPVSFTEKTMTAAVFVSKKTVGNVHFTLLEYHEFNAENQTHTIKNKVCKSLNSEYIGMECGFDEVPEWSGLVPEITFRNVEKPLFSYFRVPYANDIDLDSSLGVSVYAKIGGISAVPAEITCTWGDSILEDTDKEFQRRLQMVNAGILSKEKFISWYFHCDENQANAYIPQSDGLFGGM